MPPTRKHISPDQYQLALHTFFLERSIKAVERAIHISYKIARRLVKEGDPEMGYAPIEIAVENYDPRDKAITSKDTEDKTKHVATDEALKEEKFILSTYRKRIALWLKNPKDPEGIPARVKDLNNLVSLRKQMEEDSRHGNTVVHLPYEDMTDVEWDRLVTGKGKPKR